ncbi:MAG: DUF4870 domain-containing protein, partial [Candidatus Aenigmatarchaeota archaeon]
LCYVLGWLSGIIFYFLEEDNKFIRFHAVQSIITFLGITILIWIVGFIVSIMSMVIPFAFMLGGVTWLIGILSVILWLVLMLKAYKGEKYKLPVVGDIAEKHA